MKECEVLVLPIDVILSAAKDLCIPRPLHAIAGSRRLGTRGGNAQVLHGSPSLRERLRLFRMTTQPLTSPPPRIPLAFGGRLRRRRTFASRTGGHDLLPALAQTVFKRVPAPTWAARIHIERSFRSHRRDVRHRFV